MRGGLNRLPRFYCVFAQWFVQGDYLDSHVAHFREEAVQHGAAQKNVYRERADWPKTTCEMLSCCAKRMSALETFLSVRFTTFAPSSRAMRSYSSKRWRASGSSLRLSPGRVT